MDLSRFQKEIDLEKPFFDYARYFLTTAAWWTALFIFWGYLQSKPLTFGAVLPYAYAGVLSVFGIALHFRLFALTDRLSRIVFAIAREQGGRTALTIAFLVVGVLQMVMPAGIVLFMVTQPGR